jgi:hypothetical protein
VSYQKGTTVTLTASPVNGVSTFDGWSGGGISGTSKTVMVIMNENVTITASFKDTAKADTIRIEAENFTQKNGNNIVTEQSGNVTSLGYIESGNSTTYQVSVNSAGSFRLTFRVASGLEKSSLSISVDGINAGSLSFDGTNDNSRWTEWKTQTLNQNINLDAGKHTIQINYISALNLDWIGIIPVSSAPVKKAWVMPQSLNAISIAPARNGFTALLPATHTFSAFALYDYRGRVVRSGSVCRGTYRVDFSDLNQNVWILQLHGSQGVVAQRVVTR